MNMDRLRLMQTLLREVAAGTWKVTAPATVELWAFEDSLCGERHSVRMDAHQPLAFGLREWIMATSENTCGYAACAIGHACLDKRFTEAGLCTASASMAPRYHENFGWSAVAAFFDIGVREASRLFSPRPGVGTPQDVIEAIDRFIDSRQA